MEKRNSSGVVKRYSKMTNKICDGCNKEIDNTKENSMTIIAGISKLTICQSCAKNINGENKK